MNSVEFYLYGIASSMATVLAVGFVVVVNRVRSKSVNWMPSEATITSLKLVSSRAENDKIGHKFDSMVRNRFRIAMKVVCKYQYSVGGKLYEADTVTPINYVAANGLLNCPPDLCRDLALAENMNDPVKIIVDPIDPRRSLISRDCPWKSMLLMVPLGLVITFFSFWAALDYVNGPNLLKAILISAVITAIVFSYYQRKQENNGRFLARIIG